MKQNPFSLYDFLGYLTPGAIFLYVVLTAFVYFDLEQSMASYLSTHLGLDKPERYVPLILASYGTGHVLSFLSSITVERYSIWAFGYPSKYLLGLETGGYFSGKETKLVRWLLRTLVFIILAPVSIFDLLLGKFAGMRELYARKLDDLLIEILRTKFIRLIKDHAGIEDPDKYGHAIEHDFFRYAYHFAVEHSPNHVPKMQNYVALYGFLRTLTLICNLLFWMLVWQLLRRDAFIVDSLFWVAIATAIVNYVLFMSFVKFYRRFSLEAMMAFAVAFK